MWGRPVYELTAQVVTKAASDSLAACYWGIGDEQDDAAARAQAERCQEEAQLPVLKELRRACPGLLKGPAPPSSPSPVLSTGFLSSEFALPPLPPLPLAHSSARR